MQYCIGANRADCSILSVLSHLWHSLPKKNAAPCLHLVKILKRRIAHFWWGTRAPKNDEGPCDYLLFPVRIPVLLLLPLLLLLLLLLLLRQLLALLTTTTTTTTYYYYYYYWPYSSLQRSGAKRHLASIHG